MSYLHSNPLAEHNSGIALSSKAIPQNSGTGNMYPGQAGRAFVQGGGGASNYYSADAGTSVSDSAHARGSYLPVSVGSNSVAKGGRSRSRSRSRGYKKKTAAYRRSMKCKKCKCDIIITGGGVRRHSRLCKHKCCNKSLKKSNTRRRLQQYGGSTFTNAAYSIGGAGTGVAETTALANPAPYTAYNSCHPVA